MAPVCGRHLGLVRLKIHMTRLSSPLVAGCGALVFALIAGGATWTSVARTTTDDRNGDGRPDVWRTYDRDGRLVEVAVDSNFDGRSDVEEYYTGGDLIRRESDRNFDDRIDLVEEFDSTTHAQVRATIDTDFDGVADLLILFQDGRPVYTKRTTGVPGDRILRDAAAAGIWQGRQGNAPIAGLEDPFAGDVAARSEPPRVAAVDVTSIAAGVFVCAPPVDVCGSLPSDVWSRESPRASVLTAFVRSPRGPPRPADSTWHRAA